MTIALPLIQSQTDLRITWAQIANWNNRIRTGSPRALTADSIHLVESVEAFRAFIIRTPAHPIGTGLAIGDLCFIQQSHNGDRWLVLKGEHAVDGIALYGITRSDHLDGFLQHLLRLKPDSLTHYWASPAQRRKLFGSHLSLVEAGL